MIEKQNPLRSAKHRKIVASLCCVRCEKSAPSQCAHRNEGKGFSIKACDSQTFPLCLVCHWVIDQSGTYPKNLRREVEQLFVENTRDDLIRRGQWLTEVEAAYQKIKQREGSACTATAN